MKQLIYLVLLISSCTIQAESYIDLMLEYHDKSKDSFIQRNGDVIQNTIGVVEIGYEVDKYSVYFRHQSSIPQKDTGFNVIGLKVRVW